MYKKVILSLCRFKTPKLHEKGPSAISWRRLQPKLLLRVRPSAHRSTTPTDAIWVIVDRLTKVAHFIPVKTTYKGSQLAELYMARIVCLHGVPNKIVSDRGSQFTSRFWRSFHENMNTKLNFSTAYHP
jgi:transposase InsO family protein